jgi:hypothetical protein
LRFDPPTPELSSNQAIGARGTDAPYQTLTSK